MEAGDGVLELWWETAGVPRKVMPGTTRGVRLVLTVTWALGAASLRRRRARNLTNGPEPGRPLPHRALLGARVLVSARLHSCCT